MKLIVNSANNTDDSDNDKKSCKSGRSNTFTDEEARKNHRLNQNRISAMKCRQKKKQQFKELMEKKETLEKDNLEMTEKYDNLQKQLKETKEENEDLKKRLDFMEKQQKILFGIVRQSRTSIPPQSFHSTVAPIQTVKTEASLPFLQSNVSPMVNNQMEIFIKNESEQKVGVVSNSAFKPSKCSSPSVQMNKSLATPTPQLAQLSSIGLGVDHKIESGMSQTKLLSDICATLMGKQM
ncbi:unnamed protein product [Moneuplotes crassus]|uniref:BZIP domain-containing protein n=1 Tax=Euplotes crassus TaxID=5936 RepID=A0AAD1XQE8_EUPCR|nr:unnamed protein product [Moneuplotes crassus]